MKYVCIVILISFFLGCSNLSNEKKTFSLKEKVDKINSTNEKNLICNLFDVSLNKYSLIEENIFHNKNALVKSWELNGKTKVIVLIKGRGLWGEIFSYLLFNPFSREISHIVIDLENENYYDRISRHDIEDQLNSIHFVLNEIKFELIEGKKIRYDNYSIDGVSGATVTNTAIVDMFNIGKRELMEYHKLGRRN